MTGRRFLEGVKHLDLQATARNWPLVCYVCQVFSEGMCLTHSATPPDYADYTDASALPLSSEYGTHKVFEAIFWPWL